MQIRQLKTRRHNFCLSLSISFSFSGSLSLSLCLSLFLCLSVSLCLCVSVSLSDPGPTSLSHVRVTSESHPSHIQGIRPGPYCLSKCSACHTSNQLYLMQKHNKMDRRSSYATDSTQSLYKGGQQILAKWTRSAASPRLPSGSTAPMPTSFSPLHSEQSSGAALPAVPVQRCAGSGHPSPSPPPARVHYSRSTAGTLDVRCMCIPTPSLMSCLSGAGAER